MERIGKYLWIFAVTRFLFGALDLKVKTIAEFKNPIINVEIDGKTGSPRIIVLGEQPQKQPVKVLFYEENKVLSEISIPEVEFREVIFSPGGRYVGILIVDGTWVNSFFNCSYGNFSLLDERGEIIWKKDIVSKYLAVKC